MNIRLTFRPDIGDLVTVPGWGDFICIALKGDVCTLDDCYGFTLLANCHEHDWRLGDTGPMMTCRVCGVSYGEIPRRKHL